MKSQKHIINILFIAGITGSILISNDNSRPIYYQHLWVLPLVFSIFIMILSRFNGVSDIKYYIVVALFSMRNIVSPILMRFGNYSSYFPVDSQSSVNRAIILMLYESIVVVTYSSILSKQEEIAGKEKKTSVIHTENRLKYSAKSLGLIFIAFLSLIIVFRPSFFGDYISLFSFENIREIAPAESSSALQTLFGVFFPIIYTFFGVYLISISNTIIGVSSIRTIVCLFALCLPLFFMNNSDAFSLICVISLGFVATKTNRIKAGTFFAIICGGTFIAAIYILLAAANMSLAAENKTVMQKLSDLFVAYFPGVSNTSGLFNMQSHSKFETLFYDFYVTIPYRNTLFGLTDDYRLVKYLCLDNDTNSQVMPCIVQMFYYFSVFGAFIECIFIKIGYKTFNKIGSENNPFLMFAHSVLFIYMILTPVSYNFTNVMARVNITIIPMLIIYSFVEDKKHMPDKKQATNIIDAAE